VNVVQLDTNIGFGRAVNLGASHAVGRYVLLLNPDTSPVGDVVGALVAYAEAHPEHRIYTGRTLHADGTDDGHSVHALPSLWGYICYATALSTAFRRSRFFNPDGLAGFDRSVGGEVPAVSGCLMLVDLKLWRELDGFTPDYFMYSEDIDLSQRARSLGAAPALVPDALLLHVGGAASSSVNKRVMVLRGKTTFVRLRWSRPRAFVARFLLATGVFVRGVPGGVWREVWRQRSVWLPGWPSAPASNAATVRSA
jgi:GT2 family glycosyltransferase